MSTDATPVSYRDALNQALREELARDPDVFLLGEDSSYVTGQDLRVDGGDNLF